MQPTSEDLLGYLLNALDDQEQAQIEAALAEDFSLQQQLKHLEELLPLLEPARQPRMPPAGLAERTCQWIIAHSATFPERGEKLLSEALGAEPLGSLGQKNPEAHFPSQQAAADPKAQPEQSGRLPSGGPKPLVCSKERKPAFMEAAGPGSSAPSWRWLDLAAVLSIGLVLVLLIGAAIHQSRFRSEILRCQDNLRGLGQALHHYSQLHQELFPPIPPEGPLAVAGVYGPILLSGGFIEDQRVFWCPGALRQGAVAFPMPTMAQLQQIDSSQQESLTAGLGGSYGYCLGYMDQGQYRPIRNRHRSYFVLLADAPQLGTTEVQSLHHGGKGQNVCFEDGHVEFISGCRVPPAQDHIYLNHQGVLAPGIGPEDAVVAPGWLRVGRPARPVCPTPKQP